MTPNVADKLAKLLRITTSRHDGEVLAAVNRINALVTANDIDWDQVPANGNGAPLLNSRCPGFTVRVKNEDL
jgi:hypothetical protein